MREASEEAEWQPVRIAPAKWIRDCHPNSDFEFWKKHEGKLVFARRTELSRIIGGSPTCLEAFELREDFWMTDDTGWPVGGLCEHQILAD